MLQRLRLGTKLTLVVALSISGLLLATAVSFVTVQRVRINSPKYNEIIENEELIADVLPPPSFIVEPYLLVQQLVASNSSVEAADLTNRLRFARTEYFQSHDRWQATLGTRKGTEDLRRALLEDSHVNAVDFWRVVDERFLPAIDRGDKPAAAALATGPLTEAFNKHRVAIDRVVALSTQRRADLEAKTDSFLTRATLIEFILIGLLIAAIALVSTALVRSIRRPLARLTQAARETANHELPVVVGHFESSGGDQIPIDLMPITAETDDELGELAEALSSVRSTAVELAGRQAVIRRNVSEMFVNLGRRNSSLINRQLAFIDGLERNEDDPRTLEELYRLDHLATRMRRNAESLLVLAGSDSGRRQNANAEVIDLLRASLSEIEDYRQVELSSVDPGLIKSQAVSDVIHLFAELLENATAFSPPNKPVVVHGRRLPDGYVVSIVDEGVGMSAQQLDDANSRIESPDAFEASPSKVLGHYVVGRLAARHDIGVRLTESAVTGVTARVVLQANLLADISPPSKLRPAPLEDSAAATSEVHEAAPVAPVPPARVPQAPESPWSAQSSPAARAGVPDSGDEPAVAAMPVTAAAAPPPMVTLPPLVPAPPLTVPIAKDSFVGGESVESGPAESESEADSIPSAPASEATVDEVEFVAPSHFDDAGEGEGEADGGARVADHADPLEPPAPIRTGDSLGALADAPAEPLQRRTRGAQLPDTGAERETFDPAERSPDEVRSMLGRFYQGVRDGNREMPVEDPADTEDTELPDEHAEHAEHVNGVAAPVPEVAIRDSVRQDALMRRVRGAQLPDTGGPRTDDGPVDRSPDEVRSMLDRFRFGVDQGREASDNTPTPAPEES